ncbi:MAG: hypothetical protein H0U37_07965 [Chloroflexi bacterium]|nr:hypothetical protein [Chloroflexota bacterium]
MPSFRARLKARPVVVDELDGADRLILECGPPPRHRLTAAEEARLSVLWSIHRDYLLAASSPGLRPWAWLRYEPLPESVREPGPIRDALVRNGTLGALEVGLQDASSPVDFEDPAVAAHMSDAR